MDTVITRQVGMVAQMARRFNVPEGDGTMLDHTVFVFMPDNGDQHHSPSSMAHVTSGPRSIPVDVPREGQANHRQVSNLFNTLGWCAGEALNDFGADSCHLNS